jgi:hypothetical protein
LKLRKFLLTKIVLYRSKTGNGNRKTS